MSSFRESEKIYIMGDFNINLFHNNASVKLFEETFICNGFNPVISTATHCKPNFHKSCIDNNFVKNVEGVPKNGTIETDISHYKSLFLISEVNKIESRTDDGRITISHCYSLDNLDRLNKILSAKLMNDSPSNFSDFVGLVQNSIDESCKLKKEKITNRNVQNYPWISMGLINSIAKRDRLYFKWKKKTVSKGCKSGNLELYEDYRKYRNMLSNLIKKTKIDYYNSKFSSVSGDKKKIWKIINSLRGKSKQSLPSSFKIGGKDETCHRTIANRFNRYFSSLAKNMNKDIDLKGKDMPKFHNFLSKSIVNSVYLNETSSKEITNIISEFKNGKASDFPIMVIKHIKDTIAPYLCKLYNNCISSGTFPQCLKTGKITPVYKKGGKDDISNYRPVSTLPLFGKIFEKIIYTKLYSFLTDNSVLTTAQFGFRKFHSTSYAINHSVNLINNFQNQGNHTVGIFIDLSKAFDTLDHATLLSKLEWYGIRGVTHELLRNYLTYRYQLTNISGTYSDKKKYNLESHKEVF